MLKELSGQVFALVRELPKPLSREEMRELKRLCRFLNNTVKDQERKQEVRINPGVKKNRETDGESGVRVGVEAFRRDFYGGFNIRKCKKFVVLLHHGSLQRMRSGKGFALCAWRRIGIKNIKI